MTAEPTRRATQGSAVKKKKRLTDEAQEYVRPVILVPTPAQLARGERIVDADEEIWPLAVKQMVNRAERCGWAWRATYSSFLDVTATAGKHKGERVVKHVIAVRLRKGLVSAWGAWMGVDGEGWAADCAQAQHDVYGRTVGLKVSVLEELVTGTMVLAKTERGGAHVEPAGKSAVVPVPDGLVRVAWGAGFLLLPAGTVDAGSVGAR